MDTLKKLLFLAVFAVLIMLAWKTAPAFYAKYEFSDYLDSQVKVESYKYGQPDSMIAETVAHKAVDLGITLTADQVHVQHNGRELNIFVDYDVPIDMPLHPFVMHFHVESQNRSI